MNHIYSVSYNELSFVVVALHCLFVYFIDTTDVQVFTAYQNSGKIYFTFEVAFNSSILQFMVKVLSSTGKNVSSIFVWRTSDQRQLTGKIVILPVGLYYLRLFARDSPHSTYVFTNITMSVNVTWSNYWSPTPIYAPSPTLILTSPTPVSTTGELYELSANYSFFCHVMLC